MQEQAAGSLDVGAIRSWTGVQVEVKPLSDIAKLLHSELNHPPHNREYLAGLQISTYKIDGGTTRIITWGGEYGIVVTDE